MAGRMVLDSYSQKPLVSDRRPTDYIQKSFYGLQWKSSKSQCPNLGFSQLTLCLASMGLAYQGYCEGHLHGHSDDLASHMTF